jgi:dihydroxyacetone kinase-like protein
MKLSQAGAGKSEVNLSDLVGMLQTGEQGMESTRTCWPKMGRASRLGERTIGHQDAGATSCYFILRSLASAVTY